MSGRSKNDWRNWLLPVALGVMVVLLLLVVTSGR